jgi:hypothetical protein
MSVITKLTRDQTPSLIFVDSAVDSDRSVNARPGRRPWPRAHVKIRRHALVDTTHSRRQAARSGGNEGDMIAAPTLQRE